MGSPSVPHSSVGPPGSGRSLAFFGALAFPLLAAAVAAAARRRAAAALALAGARAYGLGAFAVTFAVNVPMNEALAAVQPVTAEQAGEV